MNYYSASSLERPLLCFCGQQECFCCKNVIFNAIKLKSCLNVLISVLIKSCKFE